MEVKRDGSRITVTGNVVKFDDYDIIKAEVSKLPDNSSLELIFTDALSMNSALIGFLIKCIRVDKRNLTVGVGNAKLYDMLSMLSLTDLLNVRKI